MLFRSPDLDYALGYTSTMFGLVRSYDVGFSAFYYLNPLTITTIIIGFIGSAPLAKKLWSIVSSRSKIGEDFGYALSMAYAAGIFLLSVIFVMTSTYNPFIYFRF